jgi:hypothetical protein
MISGSLRCAGGRQIPPNPATNLQRMIMEAPARNKKPLLSRGLRRGAKGI